MTIDNEEMLAGRQSTSKEMYVCRPLYGVVVVNIKG